MKDKQIIAWQRLEGLLILVLGLYFYDSHSGNWWLFLPLLFVPDISMLGYLANTKAGALVYNAGHSLVFPILLLLISIPLDSNPVLLTSAVWLAHIGMDRMLGYGLKYDDDFKHTHLGWIGKRK